MDAHEFLKTLAVVLGVAAVTTVVFQRLRQPVVLGYIIAGLLVGPHLPLPINADEHMVHTLSELGVILLMFAIGLELSIEKLVRVAPTAGVIGVIQVAVMISAGYFVGRAFGWTVLEGVFAGSAIAISSTTIIAKVFDEMKVEGSLRELVYGVLIVEDIIAIILLATMGTVSSGTGLDAGALAVTTAKLLGFLLGMVVVGLLVVPRAMRVIARLGRAETTVVSSIGLCFGLAFACAAMHYSVALGAFVAGVLICESGEGHTVEHLIAPVRDMFAAIFFVSVGMLLDPKLVIENWLAVLVLSVVVVIGKIIGVSVGGVVTGSGLRTSVKAGMSLAQIGEFSFIIASLGLSVKATRPFLFPVAVAVSALTTLTTPWLIRRSEQASVAVDARTPAWLRAVINVYGAWLERVRAAPASTSTGGRLRRLGVLLVVDGALLVGLLVGAGVLHVRVRDLLGARFGLDESWSEALFVGGAALAALPFVIGVVSLSRSIALTITGAGGEGDVATRSGAARSIALIVQLGLVTAVAAVSIMVVEPFVPAGVGALLIGALIVFAAFAFWRSARRFSLEARAGAHAVMEAFQARIATARGAPAEEAADAPDEHSRASVAHDLASMLPGIGTPHMMRVERSSEAAGRTLGQLDLRAKCGAAVLAIVRERGMTMLPHATERLEVGDVLAVVGSEEAVEGARALFAGRPSQRPPPAEERARASSSPSVATT